MAFRCSVFVVIAAVACGGDGSGAAIHLDALPSSFDGRTVPMDGATADTSSESPGDAQDPSSPTGDAGAMVSCGTEVCGPTEECCASSKGAHKCVTTGTCSESSFICDGPLDCPGADVCCPYTTGNDHINLCMPESECQGGGGGGLVQFCYTDADCGHLPHQPMCCDAPHVWGKICRAQCGGN